MTVTVRREPDIRKVRALQEALTASLPEWFGRPDANRHYAETAASLPAFVAEAAGGDRGLLLLKPHGTASAEIYWMAVHPDWHRRGTGAALVAAAVAATAAERRKLLFVCTLGPDDPNEHYRRTRLFYERQGFFLGMTEHGGAPDALGYYVRVIE